MQNVVHVPWRRLRGMAQGGCRLDTWAARIT
jgi:hypothetical protein